MLWRGVPRLAREVAHLVVGVGLVVGGGCPARRGGRGHGGRVDQAVAVVVGDGQHFTSLTPSLAK